VGVSSDVSGLPESTLANEDQTVMYAVIETGGKQYRVEPGRRVRVETLAGDAGTEVVFDRVLAVAGDGSPIVTGEAAASARVKATIKAQGRADKILVFKFKRKKQYKRTIGHRQDFTEVQINEIVS
jgi:large subunit ribosomal protein L21